MISKPSDIHGDMARKLNAIGHQIGFNDTCLTSSFIKIDPPLPHCDLVPSKKQTASDP